MSEFTCGGASFQMDDRGDISEIRLGDRSFSFPMGYSLFEIDERFADASLSGRDDEARLSLSIDGEEKILRITPERYLQFTADGGTWDDKVTVGLTLPFPKTAEFHIPEQHKLGRKLDADMPVGVQHSARLQYNFVLVDCGGLWLRFQVKEHTAYQRSNRAGFVVARHPEHFLATFTWQPKDCDASLAVFPSMDAAIDDFQNYLEKDLGIRKLRDDKTVPEWVSKVPLVLIVDMLRPHGIIAHDYHDVTGLARDLKKAGCPRETLFYLPGWNGDYDAIYPAYTPHEDLGGEEAFRDMMETMHACGFRVMVHTNPWGVDPSHPDIDRLLQYVVKDKDGKYAGFQTASRTKWGQMAPSFRMLKFRTHSITIDSAGEAAGDALRFKTVTVPDGCEALLTLGGMEGTGRLAVTIGRRVLKTPPGWFEKNSECTIEFPFLLRAGENPVSIKKEGEITFKEAWYRIHDCRVPPNPYATWSYPILFADTHNPEWNKIFVENVARAVEKYHIDAIHCDATEYEWNKPVYRALKERLPDLPVSGEGFNTFSCLGYYSLAQSHLIQTLTGYLDAMRGTAHQGAIPDTTKMDELLGWLDKESPVSDFVDDYMRVYPHLCAANGFVPISKVCNHSDPALSPRNPEYLWKVTRDAQRLHCIPGLRINYRDHGLDKDTKKAIREIAGW